MNTIDNKNDFKNWLMGKNPEEVVGKARRRTCCPLANYSDCYVSWIIYETNDGEEFDLPLWAKNFIQLVDDLPFGTSVTASQALEFLEEVAS